jgi:hypothetical protein
MARPNTYPRELRERAIRVVAELRPDYPSEHAAMTAVAGMLGILSDVPDHPGQQMVLPGAARAKVRNFRGPAAAKSAAMMSRSQEKGAYALAFVIMYAPGGSRATAASMQLTRTKPALASRNRPPAPRAVSDPTRR